jgi:clan AA aspartic protease
MIIGSVNGELTPYVELKVRGPLGDERKINFLLDTGFNAQIALPSHYIGALSLLYLGIDYVTLADGTRSQVELHQAVLEWDGQERNVVVTTLEDDPLLGTELLFEHDVTIRFVVGGPVSLQRQP